MTFASSAASTMMKIAIAGTNGLAQFIAYYLSETTPHSFVFLTRKANPGLKERGWQVLVVEYDNQAALTYTLKGVDLVVSTISAEPQHALIDAAASARVRHFIPSAFSGPEQCQAGTTNDEAWQKLIELLDRHETTSSLRYTIFTCGVFYERFGPGGLNNLHVSTFENLHGAVGEEGNFLIDFRAGKSTIPVLPGDNELAICMISARDAARYLVASLGTFQDFRNWPKEYKFCTERLTMSQLLNICSRVRGAPIVPNYTTTASLCHSYEAAKQSGNDNKALSASQHIAVAQAHPALNFPATNINLPSSILTHARVTGTETALAESFEAWLLQAWTTQPPALLSTRASANTSGRTSGKSSGSGSSQKSKRTTPQ